MAKFGLFSSMILLLVTFSMACPNKHFVKKHICKYCEDSQEEAEAFAAKVHLLPGIPPADRRSIFIAPDMKYQHDKKNGMCIFLKAASKYDCFPESPSNDRKWGCKFMGKVIAQHHRSDPGHYFCEFDYIEK